MKINKLHWAIFISLAFAMLFYKQQIGLNLLIFQLILAAITLYENRPLHNKPLLLLMCSIMLISSMFFVINYSSLALIVNMTSAVLFAAYSLYPYFRSLHLALPAAIINLPHAVSQLPAEMNKTMPRQFRPSYLTIFLIPVLIVFVYTGLYSASSPFFNEMMVGFFDKLFLIFEWELDVLQILLLLASGLLIGLFFLFNKKNSYAVKDQQASEIFIRNKKRSKRKFPLIALKNEIKSGIFLFLVLNVLLAIVNLSDIYHVWFNFSFEGQYLKEFVHEGTYMLIMSILIAIGLILYYFRGNINFFHNNFLKTLAYVWLAQNAVLALSVGIRNSWYIYHYALAYKRIGVFFFLLFVLVLIVTVMLKVKNRNSTYYLLKINGWSALLILLTMSAFNWDNIIASYNLKHFQRSFVHFNFLAQLPDKSLHLLNLTEGELIEIDRAQKEIFPQFEHYMTHENYSRIIENRTERFETKMQDRKLLSWNYAEHKALRGLQKREH